MATKEKTPNSSPFMGRWPAKPNSSPFMGRWPAKPAGGARRSCFSELLPIHGEVAGEAGRRGPRAVLQSNSSPFMGRWPAKPAGGAGGAGGARGLCLSPRPHPPPAAGTSPRAGKSCKEERPGRSPEFLPIHGEVAGEAGRSGPRLCLSPRPHPPPAAGTSPRAGKSSKEKRPGPKPRTPPHSWGGGRRSRPEGPEGCA